MLAGPVCAAQAVNISRHDIHIQTSCSNSVRAAAKTRRRGTCDVEEHEGEGGACSSSCLRNNRPRPAVATLTPAFREYNRALTRHWTQGTYSPSVQDFISARSWHTQRVTLVFPLGEAWALSADLEGLGRAVLASLPRPTLPLFAPAQLRRPALPQLRPRHNTATAQQPACTPTAALAAWASCPTNAQDIRGGAAVSATT